MGGYEWGIGIAELHVRLAARLLIRVDAAGHKVFLIILHDVYLSARMHIGRYSVNACTALAIQDTCSEDVETTKTLVDFRGEIGLNALADPGPRRLQIPGGT